MGEEGGKGVNNAWQRGIVIDTGNPGVFSHVPAPVPARTRTRPLRVTGMHGFGTGEGRGLNP